MQSRSDRPWWRRASTWLALAVIASAIGWAVPRALDRGASKLHDEPLIRVAIETDPARVYAASDPPWQAYGFVTHRPVEQLGRAPSSLCRKWRRWAVARSGIDADQSRLYAFLQGRASTAVVITGLDVQVVRRSTPLRGTHAYCPAGGATASPRLIDIDLDTRPATVLYSQPGDDYPARHRLLLTLAGPQTETLELVAHTRRCDCQWRARVHMVVNGQRHELMLDNAGRPFRTSASGLSRHVQWTGGRWRPMSRQQWRRTLPMVWAGFRP